MAQDIYKTIIARGENAANEIKDGAEEAAQKRLSQAEDEAARDRAARLLRLEKDDREARVTADASLELSSRQARELARKEIISRTTSQACQAMRSLTDEELFRYVTTRIATDHARGDERLRISLPEQERYLRVFGQDLSRLNEALAMTISLGSPLAANGGFILEGADFDLDETYETVIREVSEENETRLASLLFPVNA